MAGKKKAANPKRKAAYNNYRATNRKAKNKAHRIAKNILSSKNPLETAKKVIPIHPNSDVQSLVKRKLKAKGVEV